MQLTEARVTRRWARFVATVASVAGHPFVLAPLSLLVVTRRYMPPATADRVAILTTVAVVGPVIVLILRQTRRGVWTNFDVSVREHRPALYVVSLCVTALAGIALYGIGVPQQVLRGFVGAMAMITLGAVINHYIKVSLHSAFAAFIATSLIEVSPSVAVAIGIALPFIAWSRVVLGRHSWPEVVTGLLLGGIVGFGVAF